MLKKRDVLLASSDWVVARYVETGIPIPQEWKTYRQSLRDITTFDPLIEEVEWPTKP